MSDTYQTEEAVCFVFVVLSSEHKTKLQIVESFAAVWVCLSVFTHVGPQIPA